MISGVHRDANESFWGFCVLGVFTEYIMKSSYEHFAMDQSKGIGPTWAKRHGMDQRYQR